MFKVYCFISFFFSLFPLTYFYTFQYYYQYMWKHKTLISILYIHSWPSHPIHLWSSLVAADPGHPGIVHPFRNHLQHSYTFTVCTILCSHSPNIYTRFVTFTLQKPNDSAPVNPCSGVGAATFTARQQAPHAGKSGIKWSTNDPCNKAHHIIVINLCIISNSGNAKKNGLPFRIKMHRI